MDYEKKYNEALNWMRELYPGLHGATKEDAEHYFPELRESEDERIRKKCMDFIRKWSSKEDRDECLAYLEKQKGENHDGKKWIYQNDYLKVLDCRFNDGKNEVLENPEKYGLQKEQEPTMIQWTGKNLKEVIDFTGKSQKFGEWFKSWEDFENYVHSHDDILKLFCEDGSHYEVPAGAWIVKTPDGYNIPSHFRFIQKPTEWSEDWREEDIQTRFAFYTYKDDPSVLYLSNVFVEETSRNHGFGTRILKAAEKAAEAIGAITICLKVKQDSPANAWYRKHGYGYVAFEDGYDWLEKNLEYLKPTKSEDWSEEDKKILHAIELHINQLDSNETINGFSSSDMLRVLKSIRPQWSEEDEKKIIFLERLIKYNVPEGIYGYMNGAITKSEAIAILKSLHPQSQWKHSEKKKKETLDGADIGYGLETAIDILENGFTHYQTDDGEYERKQALDVLVFLLNETRKKEDAKLWSKDIIESIVTWTTEKLQLYSTKESTPYVEAVKNNAQKVLDWAKEQWPIYYGWKPSEEQMEHLKRCFSHGKPHLPMPNQHVLESLYNDLLKLM